MLADWKRPSSVSSCWPFGWGAWGAAVQLGIEINTGLASLSDPGPSADGVNAYLRIELPKPFPPATGNMPSCRYRSRWGARDWAAAH